MKKIITIHFILRIAPAFLLILLTLIEFAQGDSEGRGIRFCSYLIASSLLYLAHPMTRDDIPVSSWFCASASLYFIVAAFLCPGGDKVQFYFLIPSAVIITAYLLVRILLKYKEPIQVFRTDAAWCCAEEDSRTLYSLIVLSMLLALMIFNYENVGWVVYVISAIIAFALNIILHLRILRGRTFIMGNKKERRIQSLLASDSHIADVVPEVDKSILSKAFRRIEQLMKEHKPYLDDRFTLDRMSELLKINKVYISRAINKFSNKNFRQYVNWYRVMHSLELMRSDPWLKVIELAMMSGFHSQVTYNMCFKMFLNKTPSDILIKLRLQKPVPESSRTGADPLRAEAPPSLQGGSE